MRFTAVVSVLALSVVTSQAPARDVWPMVDYNFDAKNVLESNALPVPRITESLNPTRDMELGPAYVAKGRPFLTLLKEGITSRLTSTVAPGTDYGVGLDSSCVTMPDGRCKRDNAFFIRVSSNRTNPNVADKVFFRFVPSTHPHALTLSDSTPLARYLSFDLKFDRFYERVATWSMIMQAYQGGGGPALSLQMVRSSDPGLPPSKDNLLEMSVIALNNEVFGLEDPHPPGSWVSRKHVGGMRVVDMCPAERILFKRGIWYNIKLEMAPSYIRANGHPLGYFALYVDNTLTCERRINWGLSQLPQATPAQETPHAEARMNIDIGIYRGRSVGTQQIYFDNIRYGPTFGMVNESPNRNNP